MTQISYPVIKDSDGIFMDLLSDQSSKLFLTVNLTVILSLLLIYSFIMILVHYKLSFH
jgi:hypothetical protein